MTQLNYGTLQTLSNHFNIFSTSIALRNSHIKDQLSLSEPYTNAFVLISLLMFIHIQFIEFTNTFSQLWICVLGEYIIKIFFYLIRSITMDNLDAFVVSALHHINIITWNKKIAVASVTVWRSIFSLASCLLRSRAFCASRSQKIKKKSVSQSTQNVL